MKQVTFLLSILLMVSFSSATTVTVNPGESIQAAIDAAHDEDTVIVMPGTYYENINLLGKSITLRSNDPTDPAVVTSTIIDGNQAGSVITCNSGEDPNTVISGFVITNGNARYGGGMANDESSPSVMNCTFISNTAFDGGGMYNFESSPSVTNCTFSGNSTDFGRGGGMCNFSLHTSPTSPLAFSLTISNCIFSGNTAEDDGGGIYNEGTSPTVSGCIFRGNTARHGGGMHNQWLSSPTMVNCTFSGNTARSGGGMYNSMSSATVSNCTFSGNFADLSGGGMYNSGHVRSRIMSPSVTNCTFSGNATTVTYDGDPGGEDNWMLDYGGGGMYNRSSSPTVTNCTFSGNTVTGSGGGMFNGAIGPSSYAEEYPSSPIVSGCTFSGNSAVSWGGGMFNSFPSSATVTGSYFCLNTPEAIDDSYTDGGGNNLQFCPPPRAIEPDVFGDSDGDGDVDMIDFAAFAENWLVGVED